MFYLFVSLWLILAYIHLPINLSWHTIQLNNPKYLFTRHGGKWASVFLKKFCAANLNCDFNTSRKSQIYRELNSFFSCNVFCNIFFIFTSAGASIGRHGVSMFGASTLVTAGHVHAFVGAQMADALGALVDVLASERDKQIKSKSVH